MATTQRLSVTLPADTVGPGDPGGPDVLVALSSPVESLAYGVDVTFVGEFGKGGHLTGLAGADWAVELMWREDGAVAVLLKNADQPDGDYIWTDFNLTSGATYRLGLEVELNTAGIYDGALRVYAEGVLLTSSTTTLFRSDDADLISAYLLRVFRGETADSDPDDWAVTTEATVDLDNIAWTTTLDGESSDFEAWDPTEDPMGIEVECLGYMSRIPFLNPAATADEPVRVVVPTSPAYY